MTLFYFIAGFSWMTILFSVIGFVIGYLVKVLRSRSNQSKRADTQDYEKRIKQLENDLRICNEQNKLHLDRISSRLQEASSGSVGIGDIVKGEIEADLLETQEETVDGVIDKEGPAGSAQEEPTRRRSKFESITKDNLQIIEGIGPKMESVLKENGISNWKVLGEQTNESLRRLLEKYGNKYKIIDPDSWPGQAGLAASGSWSQLVGMQKGLDGGGPFSQASSSAKVEKIMVKLGILKEYKLDDLKAMEGIGPKIADLLSKEGINTWKELSKTAVNDLQKILDKAGKRYQLADPATWPKQAALADEGRFDELSDYQDMLQGGATTPLLTSLPTTTKDE